MAEEKILTLLVVDDEQGMRMGIRRSLKYFSMNLEDTDEVIKLDVIEATSGEEAILLMQKSSPDIVLLDNKMDTTDDRVC